MKKENWYFRLFDKAEKKYCEKHGREKFLRIASKDFGRLLFVVILTPPIAVALALFWGLNYINSSDTFFFALGIFFISTSGIMLLLMIPLVIILPFHRRRSKRCKEELQKMKHKND